MTRVIDIHAHFYPARYLDAIEAYGYSPGTVYSNADPRASTAPGARTNRLRDRAFVDLDLRLKAMDAQGVTMHAVSVPPPYVFAPRGDLLATLARIYTAEASAAHQRHPDRIVALATLPVHDPHAALEELGRASRLPGVRGVSLGTHFAGRPLSDPAYLPLYKRIESLGLPIVLHYAPLCVIGQDDRLTQFHLSNVIGNTTETAIAAAHLIFGGVLDACPALEVCLPHSGGVFPILAGRLDRAYETREECRHLPRPPSAYLRRFTYDTVCHSQEIMQFLLKLAGPDRVALGSDYCFDMGYERPVEVVQRIAGLADREREQILGGNAARLLRL